MAWQINEPYAVPQAIDEQSTTQRLPVGKIVRAQDLAASNNQGEGEFIYLQGVANLTQGELVFYNASTGATFRQAGTARAGGALAVSMTALGAGSWGWYQISGIAIIKKTANNFNPNLPIYLAGTTGRIQVAVRSGAQLMGARGANTATVSAAVSTLAVQINRPHTQGQTI